MVFLQFICPGILLDLLNWVTLKYSKTGVVNIRIGQPIVWQCMTFVFLVLRVFFLIDLPKKRHIRVVNDPFGKPAVNDTWRFVQKWRLTDNQYANSDHYRRSMKYMDQIKFSEPAMFWKIGYFYISFAWKSLKISTFTDNVHFLQQAS